MSLLGHLITIDCCLVFLLLFLHINFWSYWGWFVSISFIESICDGVAGQFCRSKKFPQSKPCAEIIYCFKLKLIFTSGWILGVMWFRSCWWWVRLFQSLKFSQEKLICRSWKICQNECENVDLFRDLGLNMFTAAETICAREV